MTKLQKNDYVGTFTALYCYTIISMQDRFHISLDIMVQI